MKRLIVLLPLLLFGCASQDCSDYFSQDELYYAVEVAYDLGYNDGFATCPRCPDPPDTTNLTRALKAATQATNEALADEIEKLEADTEAELGHIKALYR